ncbi:MULTISPECIES: magnesium/cobalt transporter CorA [Galbibacter]|uniref:Magnesium transport protein CorA n=1 Tax=Galbibacter pacificus TaxID=2996052 RepID=A0ABT6FQN3_9FLAO|nr:magnesium/cobalt transporter CorA [Galbibacter pacificus]MDG3581941.1 magnesium/cobalt transporter CorA [Galbibacter pacificus]MDG3585585.1 magnesium/cobalt transporter CorA [Galbibacter pacificus]
MKNKKINLKRVIKKPFKTQQKVGKAPGTVTYLGLREDGENKISVTDYSGDFYETKVLENVEETFKFRDTEAISWINVQGLSNVEDIEKLGKYYNINPLVLEDLVNTNQRPKIDEYEDYIFCVLKMLYLDKEGQLVVEHMALILCEHAVLLFQEIEADVFDGVRERLANKFGRIRNRGADYLFFALIDSIIDQYFIVLEHLTDKIELLEEKVYNSPEQDVANSIQQIRKEVLGIRKNIFPVKEIASRLVKTEHRLIKEDTKLFLGDVLDHSIQIHETIEMLREMSMSLMEMYMSNVSNKMNEVMKVLTIMASIFIPLTFIAGIYGMNFEYMPELHHRNAYFIVLGIMFLIIIIMLIYFKRKKWL